MPTSNKQQHVTQLVHNGLSAIGLNPDQMRAVEGMMLLASGFPREMPYAIASRSGGWPESGSTSAMSATRGTRAVGKRRTSSAAKRRAAKRAAPTTAATEHRVTQATGTRRRRKTTAGGRRTRTATTAAAREAASTAA